MHRLRPALLTALGGAGALWATLFAHVWWVFGIKAGYLDGGSYPLAPSIRVTVASLARDCALISVLYLLPAVALFCAPMPRLAQLALVAVIWIVVWMLGAEGIAETFAFDFGTTWQTGETFVEVFYQPGLTPLAMMIGLGLHLWIATRVLDRRA